MVFLWVGSIFLARGVDGFGMMGIGMGDIFGPFIVKALCFKVLELRS
jgi:hypothetical protein